MTKESLSYNLLDSPFIGVIPADSQGFREVGIRELLINAHAYERIHADSPLEVVAISRLLLAILHCVHRSIDVNSWADLWKRGKFDTAPIETYLAQRQSRFDLFSEKTPFYQSPLLTLPEDKTSPSQVLCLELTSGNNAVLFDHSHDGAPVAMSAGRAARALLATQSFAIGGGKSSGGLPNRTHAPLVGAAVLMPKADTVYQSLLLGLLSTAEINKEFGSLGTAWWERHQKQLPHEEPGAPDGYLDYLTWQSRAVLLHPRRDGDRVSVPSVSYAQGRDLESTLEDPFVAFRRSAKDDTWRPVRVSRDREMWRDSGSFLAIAGTGANERRPRILEWLASLDLRGHLKTGDRLKLFGTGLDNDKAKVFLWQNAELPLPVQLLENETAVSTVRTALECADLVHRSVRQAVWVMAKYLIVPTSADSALLSREAKNDIDSMVEAINPGRRFWSAIEPLFGEFLHDIAEDPDAGLARWRRGLVATARDLFLTISKSCGGTARDLKAVAQAERSLGFGLKALVGEPT